MDQEQLFEAPTPPPTGDPWQDAIDLWSRLATEAGKRTGKIPRTGPIGRMLSARLREHGPEDVGRVFCWFWRHPDAAWWRERVQIKTVLRPSHFPDMLAKALNAPDSALQPAPPPVRPGGALAARRRPLAARKGVTRDD